MTPETTRIITKWHQDRLDVSDLKKQIHALTVDVATLEKRMGQATIDLENTLFSLEQPLGLKIGDDYVVVVQDTRSDDFVIQVVDFNLREEIKNES